MKISKEITNRLEKNNGRYLMTTTVWNVHNSGLGDSKASNVRIAVDALFAKFPKISNIYVEVGAKGRSQHSASEVLIFDSSRMNKADLENARIKYSGAHFVR